MSNPYSQGTDHPADGKKAVALLYDQLRAPVIQPRAKANLRGKFFDWRSNTVFMWPKTRFLPKPCLICS